MACRKTKPKISDYCIGDLTHLITLQDRESAFDNTSSIDTLQTFTGSQVWASIETLSGKEIFEDVNLRVGVESHLMVIAYVSGLETKKWIEYNSKRFKILRVSNCGEANEWLKFYCEEKGLKTNIVNNR
jgi:head-tail adaptor